MNKKKYIIIAVTILAFIIAILFILFRNSSSWINEVLNASSYEIYMEDCDNNKMTLEKDKIHEINKYWKDLVNNGPWTGDENECYRKLVVAYDNNGIINKKEISIIDDSSIIFKSNGTNTYYVNANNLISYLNKAN